MSSSEPWKRLSHPRPRRRPPDKPRPGISYRSACGSTWIPLATFELIEGSLAFASEDRIPAAQMSVPARLSRLCGVLVALAVFPNGERRRNGKRHPSSTYRPTSEVLSLGTSQSITMPPVGQLGRSVSVIRVAKQQRRKQRGRLWDDQRSHQAGASAAVLGHSPAGADPQRFEDAHPLPDSSQAPGRASRPSCRYRRAARRPARPCRCRR